MKEKVEENLRTTQSIIEAFSNFQNQNKGKCNESAEHCRGITRQLEELKLEMEDLQLDYKSAQEELEISKTESSALLQKFEETKKEIQRLANEKSEETNHDV